MSQRQCWPISEPWPATGPMPSGSFEWIDSFRNISVEAGSAASCLFHRKRMGLPGHDRLWSHEPTGELAGRTNDPPPPGIINPNPFDVQISPGSGKIPGINIKPAGFG